MASVDGPCNIHSGEINYINAYNIPKSGVRARVSVRRCIFGDFRDLGNIRCATAYGGPRGRGG